MDYRQYLESCRDFPKEGVLYWDFTPLLRDPEGFKQAVQDIKSHFEGKGITKIAAIESKGFTIGTALAYEWGKPLVLVRKPSLIPGNVVKEKFVKEYGEGEYQVKEGVVGEDDVVLIVYDIMAGAGASKAAINLIEKLGAKVAGCAYAIELEYLGGRDELKGYDLFSLIKIKEKNEI
jgi:adenine phosphoribosyltransferase